MQTQVIKYQAIDEETGKEVISFELRRGIMKEDQIKKDEGTLIETVVGIITSARN